MIHGTDPSTSRSGWCLLRDLSKTGLHDYGTIFRQSEEIVEEHVSRMVDVASDLGEDIAIAIETPFVMVNARVFAQLVECGVHWRRMARVMLREGVIIQVHKFAPQQWRKVIRHELNPYLPSQGRIKSKEWKKAMKQFVLEFYGVTVSEDEADAIGVARAHGYAIWPCPACKLSERKVKR